MEEEKSPFTVLDEEHSSTELPNTQQVQDPTIPTETAALVRNVSTYLFNVRGWMMFLGIIQLVIGSAYFLLALLTLIFGSIPGFLSFANDSPSPELSLNASVGAGVVGVLYLITAFVIAFLGMLYIKGARSVGTAGIMGNPNELKISLKHLSTAIFVQALSILAGVLIFVLVTMLAIALGASAG